MPLHSQPASDFYLPCLILQRSNTELVVFCPLTGQCVIVAWPMRNGVRILPHQICEWLRNRGLHLACFCSLATGVSASCQVVNRNGSVKAFCGDFPSRCGFLLDLSSVYRSALLTSEYRHLPTTASGRLPEMDNLRIAFNISGTLDDCPYFEGYFGEHVSEHPGVEQRAGSFQHLFTHGPAVDQYEIRARVARAVMDMEASANAFYADAVQYEKRKSSATTRIKKLFPVVSTPTSGSIAGMSADASSSIARLLPNSRETAIFSKIRRGTGISSYELQGLLEQCGVCKQYFSGSVLCRHIFLCTRDLTEPMLSD